jgi:hypothetical protein
VKNLACLFAFLALFVSPSSFAQVGDDVILTASALSRTDYKWEDVLHLISESMSGQELIASFKILPKFDFFENLDLLQTYQLKSLLGSSNFPVGIAINEGTIENPNKLILLHKDIPLFAAAILASHELQHSTDSDEPWQSHLYQRYVEMFQATQSNNADSTPLLEKATGMQDLISYLLEYRGFSRDTNVREQLETKMPCIHQLWKKFLDDNGITIDLAPFRNREDRATLIRAYVRNQPYPVWQNILQTLEVQDDIQPIFQSLNISVDDLNIAVKDAEAVSSSNNQLDF